LTKSTERAPPTRATSRAHDPKSTCHSGWSCAHTVTALTLLSLSQCASRIPVEESQCRVCPGEAACVTVLSLSRAVLRPRSLRLGLRRIIVPGAPDSSQPLGLAMSAWRSATPKDYESLPTPVRVPSTPSAHLLAPCWRWFCWRPSEARGLGSAPHVSPADLVPPRAHARTKHSSRYAGPHATISAVELGPHATSTTRPPP